MLSLASYKPEERLRQTTLAVLKRVNWTLLHNQSDYKVRGYEAFAPVFAVKYIPITPKYFCEHGQRSSALITNLTGKSP